jgi:hypothetical protein
MFWRTMEDEQRPWEFVALIEKLDPRDAVVSKNRYSSLRAAPGVEVKKWTAK